MLLVRQLFKFCLCGLQTWFLCFCEITSTSCFDCGSIPGRSHTKLSLPLYFSCVHVFQSQRQVSLTELKMYQQNKCITEKIDFCKYRMLAFQLIDITKKDFSPFHIKMIFSFQSVLLNYLQLRQIELFQDLRSILTQLLLIANDYFCGFIFAQQFIIFLRTDSSFYNHNFIFYFFNFLIVSLKIFCCC